MSETVPKKRPEFPYFPVLSHALTVKTVVGRAAARLTVLACEPVGAVTGGGCGGGVPVTRAVAVTLVIRALRAQWTWRGGYMVRNWDALSLET